MAYQEDRLTEDIIQCIIKVHQTLGPGFLENVYRRSLLIELMKKGHSVETEKEVIIYYEGEEVGQHRLDILVENSTIIELKTVDELSKAHYAQVRSYLKATGLQVAILVNFAKEKADFRRIERDKDLSPYPHGLPIPFSYTNKRHGSTKEEGHDIGGQETTP